MPSSKPREPTEEDLARGERIKKAREDARLTQRELADKIEFDPVHLSRVELGKVGVSRRMGKALANALVLPESYFRSPRPGPTPRSQVDRYPQLVTAIALARADGRISERAIHDIETSTHIDMERSSARELLELMAWRQTRLDEEARDPSAAPKKAVADESIATAKARAPGMSKKKARA